jgi:hypothetical protein
MSHLHRAPLSVNIPCTEANSDRNSDSKSLSLPVSSTIEDEKRTACPPAASLPQVNSAPFYQIQKVQQLQEEPYRPQSAERTVHAPVELFLEFKTIMKSYKQPLVHYAVSCFQCLANPLTGPKFECTECRDYVLCELCVAVSRHPHVFLKHKHS